MHSRIYTETRKQESSEARTPLTIVSGKLERFWPKRMKIFDSSIIIAPLCLFGSRRTGIGWGMCGKDTSLLEN